MQTRGSRRIGAVLLFLLSATFFLPGCDTDPQDTPGDTNTAPVASDGTATATSGVVKSIVLSAIDIDSDELIFSIVSPPSHGSLTLTAGASSAVYTPAADYVGADSFTFKVSDGVADSNTATVTITVSAAQTENQPPRALPVAIRLNQNTSKSVTLTGADTDGDLLSFIVVAAPQHGSLTKTATGTYTYAPNTDFVGTDTFTYKVNDGQVDSSVATVTITVVAVTQPETNHSPTADDLTATLDANTSTPIALSANDIDADPLTFAIVAMPTHGTLVEQSAGLYTYTPAADYVGTDTFTYTASDGTATSNTATVTITVNPLPKVNHAPVAADAESILPANTSQDVTLSAADPDEDPLTFALVTGPQHGTLTKKSNAVYIYMPDADFVGSDTFTYKANDGTVDSNIATVTLVVAPVWENALTVSDLTLQTSAATPIAVRLFVLNPGTDTVTYTRLTEPKHGTLESLAPDVYVYTPEADFVGRDTFVYQAEDGTHRSNPATVTIDVVPSGSHAPVAHDMIVEVIEGQRVTIPLYATDADDDPLIATVVQNPARGLLMRTAPVAFKYTAVLGYCVSDSFTYCVSDGTHTSNPATVTIVVKSCIGTRAWSIYCTGRMRNSPAISADGSIYATSTEGAFRKLSAAGTRLWPVSTYTSIVGSPAIAPDGTIIVADSDGKLLATYPDGTNKWTLSLAANTIVSTPAIAFDGTIYVGSTDGFLYAVNSAGVKCWSFDLAGWTKSSAAIGPDGTVYIGCSNGWLYAINPDGTEKWHFVTEPNVECATPAIGPDGIIYIGSANGRLYAVTPSGTLRWEFATGAAIVSSPVIAADGTVYLTSRDGKLYALTSAGVEKWSIDTGSPISASPTIGNDGRIYVANTIGVVFALNADGTRVWKYDTGCRIESSAAIHPNGLLCMGTNSSSILALYCDATGLANAGWPKLHGNALNSGCGTCNNTPEITDLIYRVHKDVPMRIVLEAHDADEDPLTFTIVTPPAHGILTCIEPGVYTYTPEPSFIGTDSFTCRASDGRLTSRLATIALNVGIAYLKWSANFSQPNRGITANIMQVAMSSQGTIYATFSDNTLRAVSPTDGSLIWAHPFTDWLNRPISVDSSAIYVVARDSLYSIDFSGKANWSCLLPGRLAEMLAIAPSGTIHVPTSTGLCAVNPDGTLRWSYTATGGLGRLAIDAQGNSYLVDDALTAIDHLGQKKWSSTGYSFPCSVAIDNDRLVFDTYNDNGGLCRLTTTGEKPYAFMVVGCHMMLPTFDTDGPTYAVSRGQCNSLLATSSPFVKWTFKSDDPAFAVSPAAIGSDGRIYVAAQDGVYALNPDGSVRWHLPLMNNLLRMDESPLIGPDGTIYVTSTTDTLYAISSEAMGLSTGSCWPRTQHDNGNTACSVGP